MFSPAFQAYFDMLVKPAIDSLLANPPVDGVTGAAKVQAIVALVKAFFDAHPDDPTPHGGF